LAVFSFHVPLAIGATILIQTGSLSSVPQILIGLLVIATLFPWAAWQERHSRRRDRANATLAAAAAVASAGAAGEKQATPANWAEVPAPG
jgi:Flp pilus assembly protein TadB